MHGPELVGTYPYISHTGHSRISLALWLNGRFWCASVCQGGGCCLHVYHYLVVCNFVSVLQPSSYMST